MVQSPIRVLDSASGTVVLAQTTHDNKTTRAQSWRATLRPNAQAERHRGNCMRVRHLSHMRAGTSSASTPAIQISFALEL